VSGLFVPNLPHLSQPNGRKSIFGLTIEIKNNAHGSESAVHTACRIKWTKGN
jgi:hypothetical protein